MCLSAILPSSSSSRLPGKKGRPCAAAISTKTELHAELQGVVQTVAAQASKTPSKSSLLDTQERRHRWGA